MTRINRLKRLAMANWFLRNERTRALAKTVIFTDEKHFKNRSDAKTVYVNRLPNTAYEEKHIKFDKPGSSAADLNVFAYIGPFGKGMNREFLMCFL